MTYIIIFIVVAFIAYNLIKNYTDNKNIIEYGGLKIKYATLIYHIMSRNPLYQLKERNLNYIELLNTGIRFTLMERNKKLHINWYWTVNPFTGKTYTLQWQFDEFKIQDEMYEIINHDISILFFMETDEMTKSQAEDWWKITNTKNEIEQKKLLEEFKVRYPKWFSKITDE